MMSRFLLSIAVAITLDACTAAQASEDNALQGIVEHDERVLAFAVGGRIADVKAERGAFVHTNDVLVQLDESLEAPIREARTAEVDAALAQLALIEAGPRREEIRAASAELRAVSEQEDLLRDRRERQQGLVDRGAIPSATLDEMDSSLATLVGRRSVLEQRIAGLRRGARPQEVDAAEAQLRAARAGVAMADTRLAQHSLRSPGDFHVTDVHAAVGEMAGPGTAAVTVADLDHPFVDVFVPEGRIARVSLGQRASVRIDGLREALPGVVEHISNRTEFTPRFLFSQSERPNLVLRVRIRIDDPRHQMRAGLPAFVTLVGTREGSP